MANGIRLQDVADLAGVSMGTASQALNYRPNVAPATRARVIDAARTLGYPVKPTPEEPAHPSLEVIGMLTKHDFGMRPDVNPFYSHVQAGVERECRNHDISLMYANIEVDPSNRPVVWPSMLSEERIDGLLLVGTFIEDTLGLLKRRLGLPIVLVDSYAPNFPFDSVVIDNRSGATCAVDYLIDQGHRNIALIGANPTSPPSILERQAAFTEALHRRGLSEQYIETSKLTQDSGYEATRRLLERAPEVTAIFACADIVAIGAISAARAAKRSVPQALSIVGFDNIDMASVVTPGLSTVHVHKTWMGTLGVRQLIQRSREPGQPKVTILVDTHLVERDSACAPAV
jgi:LacI family transcriptional regulator